MGRLLQGLVVVWAVAAASPWAGASEGLQGSRPFDGFGDEPAAEQIEWKANWDETYKANLDRWEKDAQRLTNDEEERGLLVRTRAVRLLDALIARHPTDAERRLNALKEIAGNYYACGLSGRGNYALKRLVDELPGQADFVAQALHKILEESKWEHPWAVDEGPAWVDYAASRLIALNRSGQVPDGHPAVVAAWRAQAVLRRAQGRFLDAIEALDGLEAQTGRDEWWLHEEGERYFALGREREALSRFQDLYGRNEQNWVARERVAHILLSPVGNPPAYACHFGLETTWDTVRNSPVADVAGRITEALKGDIEGKNLIPWRDQRHASLWALLDRHLLAQEPAALAPLRDAQEKEARLALRDAATWPAERLMAAYRRLPWSATAQRLLVSYGEDALRRGHAGLALRAFQDVLAHASAPALQAQAQAAKAILGRLTPPPPAAAESVPLTALERHLLRLPPIGLWPPELFGEDFPRELTAAVWPMLLRPQPCAEGVLVAGPEQLVFFGDGSARPLWARGPSGTAGRQGRFDLPDSNVLIVPGPFQPAIADGRVFARWGLDPSRRFLTGVAAFDLRNGEMLWSTADDPGLSDLWPSTDPAASDGRVYFLALRKGDLSVLPVSTVWLVCLDGGRGSLLWRRPLATQSVALMTNPYSNYPYNQFDLAHYGNAVAVDRGAVYCQTNLGFVARCDARDGVIEWTYAYPRVQLRWNVLSVLRRQGAAPVVSGERVVFVPRDCAGAFALDAATGKLAWDNPFLPTHEVIGQAEGLLLTCDERTLAALDPATGLAAWHRDLPEGLLGRPCLVATDLLVGTSAQLQRFEAKTGRLLEAAEWGAAGPLSAFAARGRRLLGVRGDAIGSDAEPVGKPLNPQAPAAQGPFRLPVARAWQLPRPNPLLLTPPPEAKLAGKLLLVSQGVLECVRATAQGGIEWQRGLEPGHQAIEYADGTILLIYPRRVAAIDSATGRLRWETEVPMPIRQWQDASPCLVLGSYSETEHSRRTCALDLASGKLLWYREFRELGAGDGSYLHDIGWDGKSLHLFATLEHRQGGGHFDVVCQPADGRITAIRRFLPKGRQWPFLFEAGEGGGFYVDQDRVAWSFTLDGQPHTRHSANLRDLDSESAKQLRRTRTRRQVQHSEQWQQVIQQQAYPSYRHSHWILQRGNAAYELRRDRPGIVRGDQLIEADDQTLRLVELPSRKELPPLRIELPSGHAARILACQEEGGTVFIVSGIERGPSWQVSPYRVQLDAFEKASGKHLARQMLDDLPFWRFTIVRNSQDRPTRETQAVWEGGMVFLTDADGLHAFAPAPAGLLPPDKPVYVAHRLDRPIALDGALDDWRPDSAIRVPTTLGRDGSVSIAHDADRLYLALACPAPAARAEHGSGGYRAGDWAEVAITLGDHTRRWAIGADERGHVAWEGPGEGDAPRGAWAAFGHDVASQQSVLELVVPLAELVHDRRNGRWRHLGVSVAVWQDGAGSGPARVLSWGGGWWAGRVVRELQAAVYLHPLTREGEEAGLALAHELPELDEAWDFFANSCELRAAAGSSKTLLDRYRDYLKRHPNGLPALRALVSLDQALRVGLESDPTRDVLQVAQETGVADAIRAWYARVAKSTLSQWLNVDPKKPALGFMLQLSDGREGNPGWAHRAVWGEDPWSDSGEPGTPSHRYAGPIPSQEGWHELRLPLLWLDLHDKPLCGIAFSQIGGGRLVWDRSAVAYEGGERVFLEDDVPKAHEVVGQWAWVGEPRKSGARAHTDANPGGKDSRLHRVIVGLEAPVADHVVPPPTGAVLSQWVYLDPAKPPRMIALSLQPVGEPFRVFWGEAIQEGRYMGPLPKAGEWQELRVPLDWTPLHCWPIRGIAFEQNGGNVTWDRTAIVKDGRETVLIDDETPPGNVLGDGQWVEQPVKSGKKAHKIKPPEGLGGHGVFYLRDPFLQHMPYDAARAKQALQQQIPKLGPTADAWRFFQAYLALASSSAPSRMDCIRWFLASVPDHPRNVELLKSLLGHFTDLKEPDPMAAVDKIIEETKLPRDTRYAFHRQCGDPAASLLRAWSVLGPFPSPKPEDLAKPGPPETEDVRFDKDYPVAGGLPTAPAGQAGKARWKPSTAAEGYVDFSKLFKPSQRVAAYAICWVHSDVTRFVSFEAGHDDGMRLWLNRKLIHDAPGLSQAAPRQETVPAQLQPGWNEILVKVDQVTGQWGFYLELLDREARSLLRDVKFTATPPARQ